MLVTLAINTVVLALVVSFHYEALRFVSNLIPHLTIAPRLRVVVAVFGALTAHFVEVWLFALAYFLMIKWGDFGELLGETTGTLFDCVYFSFISYTSLGYGDIYPVGPIRFLAGLEALTGLVLIGWTASFLYVEMTRFWRE